MDGFVGGECIVKGSGVAEEETVSGFTSRPHHLLTNAQGSICPPDIQRAAVDGKQGGGVVGRSGER